jgi:tetratricopeptide (TPR) repeat protein
MFNDLEELPVTVRPLARSIAAAAVLAVTFGVSALDAQPVRRPPRPDTPFMTVQVFRSADKQAGPAASDALRERLIQVYPGPVLWVIEKQRLVELLEQSGYPTNEQLNRTDENSLAKFQRADEYVRGSVIRQADGEYAVDAQLVLTRDQTLTQPLATSTGRSPERAAVGLVREIQTARRQLSNEKKCMEAARSDKFAEAIAEADKAIADYPNATLVRYCKMNVLVRQKASNDELIAVADEILAIDPNSRNALAIAADAHQAEGRVDKANELLVRLLAAEPKNADLATRVVDALAASRQYDVAKEVVTKAVIDNPGDVDLVRLQFLILASAGDYKAAIKTGEEMILLDTAKADVGYFTRLTALYAADSQPVKALETAKAATVKFPDNADLWQRYAALIRGSAQTIVDRLKADSTAIVAAATDSATQVELGRRHVQQAKPARDTVTALRVSAINASKRALELDPNIQNGWIQVAQSYSELGQTDSVVTALQNALTAGDNADFIATIASGVGNQMRLAGAAAQSVDTLQTGVRLLQWADSVGTLADSVGPADARRVRAPATAETRSRVKFILGATAVTLSQVAVQAGAAAKSCDLFKIADEALITAQIALPGGAAFNQAATVTLLQTIPEFQPYITQQIGTLCK